MQKIEVQFLASVYVQGTVPLTVNTPCSYSTRNGAGPGLRISRAALSMPELWGGLCTAVQSSVAHPATLSILELKQSRLKVKAPHLALESIES